MAFAAFQRILQHQNFTSKMITIAITTIVPLIAVIMFLFIQGVQEYQIKQNAIQGLDYLTESYALTQNIAAHRGKTDLYLSAAEKKPNSQQEIKALEKHIKQGFAELAKNSLTAPIAPLLSKLQSNWTSLELQTLTNNNNQVSWAPKADNPAFEAHTILIEQLIEMNEAIVSLSQLQSITENHTSILSMLYATKFPKIANQIGIARHLASSVVNKGQFSANSYLKLTNAVFLTEKIMRLTNDQLTLIQTKLPDSIQNKLKTTTQSTAEYLTFIKNKITEPDTIVANATDTFQKGADTLSTISSLNQQIKTLLKNEVENAISTAQSILIFEIVVIFATLIFGSATILAFRSANNSGFAQLSRSLHALNEGHLDHRSTIAGSDELAIMSQELNKTADQFQSSIQMICHSFAAVKTAVATIQKNMQSASNSISEQNGQMDSLATAMTEMSASANEVEHNTISASNEAQKVVQVTGEGDHIMQVMVLSIDSLTKEVSSTSEAITALAEDTKAISNVTEVIRGIAEQTNLLALNAAIEAARAGEQGRGFAVVADEVRSLAQRTRESTDEIQSTIAKLQNASAHAVTVIANSMTTAETSSAQVGEAQTALEQIRHSVSDMTDMNQQIASAATQQAATTNEMNSNIVTAQTLTAQADEQVQEVNELSIQLNQSTLELEQSLAFYKI